MPLAAMRLFTATNPAARSTTPAAGPNTIGIHILPRMAPLMSCARYVSAPRTKKLSDASSKMNWSRVNGSLTRRRKGKTSARRYISLAGVLQHFSGRLAQLNQALDHLVGAVPLRVIRPLHPGAELGGPAVMVPQLVLVKHNLLVKLVIDDQFLVDQRLDDLLALGDPIVHLQHGLIGGGVKVVNKGL